MKAFQLILTSFLVATVWADSQKLLLARVDNFFYALKSVPFFQRNLRTFVYDTSDQSLLNKEIFVSRGKYIFMKWERHYHPISFFLGFLVGRDINNPDEFEFDSKNKITNVDFYACRELNTESEYFISRAPVDGYVCETVDLYLLPVKKHVNEPELPGEEEEIQPNFKPVVNEWENDLDKYLSPDRSEPVIKSNLLNDIVSN